MAADFRDTPHLAEATWVASECQAECTLGFEVRAGSRALLLLSYVTHSVTFPGASTRTTDSTAISTATDTAITFTSTDFATTAMDSVAADMVIRGRMVRIMIRPGGGIRVRRMTKTTSANDRPRTR